MTKKRRLLTIVTVLVVAVAVGIAAWYLLRPSQQQDTTSYNPYDASIAKLLKDGPPPTPREKAIYYGQLAQNYDRLGNTDLALTNYLQAQQILDTGKLDDQAVYYQAIATIYRNKGDRTNAKSYLEKQIAYLRVFMQRTGQASVSDAIKLLEEQIKTL